MRARLAVIVRLVMGQRLVGPSVGSLDVAPPDLRVDLWRILGAAGCGDAAF